MMMKAIHELAHLRADIAIARQKGKKIVLVPTMGALHDGHLSLIDIAKQYGDYIIVTIFVNKTQFDNPDDFAKYPRTVADDMAMLAPYDIDIVYNPDHDMMYPDNFATVMALPDLANDFCGAGRPKHFDGVAIIVSKLFNQTTPDVAIFGEKDFQQLTIIRQLTKDLDFNINIIGAPTIRADNGLALSSRNRRLSDDELAIAPLLHQALCDAPKKLKQGQDWQSIREDALCFLQSQGFGDVEYFALCDAVTLQRLSQPTNSDMRILTAVHLGNVRLIDNIAVIL